MGQKGGGLAVGMIVTEPAHRVIDPATDPCCSPPGVHADAQTGARLRSRVGAGAQDSGSGRVTVIVVPAPGGLFSWSCPFSAAARS